MREKIGWFDPGEGKLVEYETHEDQAKRDEMLESEKEKEEDKTSGQKQETKIPKPLVDEKSEP